MSMSRPSRRTTPCNPRASSSLTRNNAEESTIGRTRDRNNDCQRHESGRVDVTIFPALISVTHLLSSQSVHFGHAATSDQRDQKEFQCEVSGARKPIAFPISPNCFRRNTISRTSRALRPLVRNIRRSRTNATWDRAGSWRIGREYIRAQSQDDHTRWSLT